MPYPELAPSTPEQIAEALENARNATHPSSWVWSESTGYWIPPIAKPTDGFPYLWDEATINWTPFPDYPRD